MRHEETLKLIDRVEVESECDFLLNRNMTTLTVRYSSNVSAEDVLGALRRYAPDLFADEEPDETYDPLPKAERIIFNGPATVTLWADGSKTVSKARGGDEYDPLFGLVACIIRKLTHNRGHAVDDLEEIIRELSDCIGSTEDVDALADFFALMLDTVGVLRRSSGEWLPQLGEAEPSTEEEPADSGLRDIISDIERTQDEIRQMVRNLTLDGEL